MHLVFYDDQCPLCQRAVEIARKADKNNICKFASLDSEEGKIFKEKDSFVLLENSTRPWFYAKGIFRLLWLLGGSWKLVGWLYILPKWMIDPIYRFIARQRSHS